VQWFDTAPAQVAKREYGGVVLGIVEILSVDVALRAPSPSHASSFPAD